MILGLGSDLIDIRRIEKDHRDALASGSSSRVFTDIERAKSDRRAPARRLLRQALRRQGGLRQGAGHRAATSGVFWRDMGVVNLPGGKPTMALTGGALKRLEEITPPGHRAEIDLTITDDFPLAQAIVIISAVPSPKRTIKQHSPT